MEADSQRTKGRDTVLSALNIAIETLNLAKDISTIAPAQAVFGSVSILLTMIRDSMANKSDYVELGLACANVCKALDRGMNGKKLDDLNESVREAINELTITVVEIQRKVAKQSGRNVVSRIFQARNDKDTIAGWKSDLGGILQVFNTELAMNTHVAVSDIRHDVSKIREEIGGQIRPVQTSVLGEPPPPPPRACFGRGELIEKVVGLAENLTPIALIGPGGIGKTSIALAVLHHDRIKTQFGDNRRFIRCDQFPSTHTHFLSQLSKVIGAGIENPEDLTPLRSFLSSKDIIIVVDNAESILDPQGTNALEIYAIVEELSRFDNICLCITSRISTIPSDCQTLDVPTLPTEAAREAFYRIYKNGGRSDLINGILGQLDFHPLSITLLATVAHHSKWDADRLAREWERRRVDVLRIQHNRSLAATIELSLASPMFQELGPDARGLLGVIAFFPQGIDEKILEWLFPTISDRTNIFDNFCILSLTYRNNGFITMLAPLRDHLRPKDPKSSPLLCTAKERYFIRLSVHVDPDYPGFEEAQWITSEDTNIEHLLDVFTSIDPNSGDVWDASTYFMEHLYWHKPRLVVLGSKIEGLPDDHHSKPQCLFELSRLFDSVGNYVERKRLLVHTLELWRDRGNDLRVAQVLKSLSKSNRLLGIHKEGVLQAKEALAIYERRNNMVGQVLSWRELASLLYEDKQLDAAEEAAFRVIDLPSDKGIQFSVCECHRILGDIYYDKGETEKVIDHFEKGLGIASSFNWHYPLFRINCSMAKLFLGENRFNDAHTHVERAKSHATDDRDQYNLGHAMKLQARIWCKERGLEEAKSEALHAADVFGKLGAVRQLESCRQLLQDIEKEMET